MGLAVGSLFRQRYSVFVATSYTFDLQMFDEFWLPRLGESPLNATLLIDANQLARVWEEIPLAEEWRARRANADYLVRGVNLGGWSFHPKTYLFGEEKSGILVVGSGNLSLKGLEEGHEVFAAFESTRQEDLSAMRAWRDWMWQIVRRVDDSVLSTRWIDALARLPWLKGTASPSAFTTNWEHSLLNQLAARVTLPSDELHVLAPFYDRGATALAELIRATAPAEVYLYLGANVSVDGEALIGVIAATGRPVHLRTYRPNEFVHAKLVGVVRGDRGLLLAGSANMSRAALLGATAHRTGNAEAGVLIELPSDGLRALFVPEGLDVHVSDLSVLRDLVYESSPDGTSLPLLLHSATRLEDGRVALRYSGDMTGPLQLVGTGLACNVVDRTTIAPFGATDGPLLVHLEDETGKIVSNLVPVDDPRRLAAWLQTRTAQTADVPGGLDAAELDTPVGRLLRRLNDGDIFDVDETPAFARAQSVAQETEDADFWQSLATKELRLDPRVRNYGHVSGLGNGDTLEGDLFALLRLMLDRVPQHQGPHLVDLDVGTNDGAARGQRWTPTRRLQVRVFNVLERWCLALPDPRLRWLAPTAPVRNYCHLLTALVECWTGNYLPRERLVRLARTLFSSFLRGERTLGFLYALNEDERKAALADISPADGAAAAILTYSALQFTWSDPAGSREELFAWQPFLDPALSLGVMRLDVSLVNTLTGGRRRTVSARDVEDFLLWAATHTDDVHWERRVRRELDLAELHIVADAVHKNFGITIEVGGIKDPLGDSRLVALVDLAMRYRQVTGAIVKLPQGGRLSARLDEHVYAKLGDVNFSSQRLLTRKVLASLRENAAGWGAILVPEDPQGTTSSRSQSA